MKILCIVPSKGRAQQLGLMTGGWLFPSGVDYAVFVEPQDYEEYSALYKNVIQLPENNRGLSFSLYHAQEYALAHGYDTVFKLDDDIRGWADSYDKLDPRDNVDRFKLILKDIRHPLENPNCAGVSFGYRQEFWHDKRWMAVNQRFQTCYVVKSEIWEPRVYPAGMPNEDMWEDFGNFLRVISRGYKVLRYGRYLMSTTTQSGDGGLSDFYKGRTEADYKATIELFRAQFPWLKWRVKKDGSIEPDMDNEIIGGRKL